MAKVKKTLATEPDSTYFLKILIYFVLGTIWIKHSGQVIFPVGLVLGIIIAQHDHFSIDRKIEYAILIIAALMGLIGYGVFFVWP